ncbi:MAG: CHAD domain-containing protein [Methylococcales bacterium]|nr:CHAD domain-containing protein [Methylococcales bacterium]
MNVALTFPVNLTVDEVINQLSSEIDCQLVSSLPQVKIYYDSFDWRLYEHGIICEFFVSTLTFKSSKNESIIAEIELKKVPKLSQQFTHEAVRLLLEPILEMRALLPVCTVVYTLHQFIILNEDKKTLLRLVIEEHEQINHRVFVQSLKGYDDAAESITNTLIELGLIATNEPTLIDALTQQGLDINDYSSKLAIQLTPELRADVASKIIYSCLLTTIKNNEQGTISDIDSEFLHDFRVAVRRTRAALSQLKDVLPHDVNSRYAKFFSWLGAVTSPTRDLDVYLLNFTYYKSILPVSMRGHLKPLHDYLCKKQKQAQRELAKNLCSTEYLTTLAEWEKMLSEPTQSDSIAINAGLTIKTLADKRLWKSFKRVLREGEAITDQSPAEALHDLRKSCKKLRYLMEFLQSLYEKNAIKALIKSLKGLQEVLGDFQDCEVQEYNLKLFSEEMQTLNTPTETFLAMGSLIQSLDTHRREIRSHFSLKFAEFKQEETLATFNLLFRH